MIRKIGRYALYASVGIALFLGSVWLFPKVNPQQQFEETPIIMPVRQLDSLYWAMQIDELRKEYSANKTLLPGFELQTLLALRYYPALRDTRIKFVYKQALIPLSSRPNLFTMFGPRERWEYRIIVSNRSMQSMEPILLKNLHFDAQVAILAHELAHSLHYQQYNFWEMLKFGLLYGLSSDFRAKHERSTDEQVIHRGLGWQLFEYASYVRTAPGAAESYKSSKDFLDKYYLTPTDIMQVMTTIPAYGLGALQ